ncbi:MAG: putative lipid II flippase FtsW [Firmicutes bacterium]|nr:putative lipid II flippase FtsW [Bacillota bacterium]
MFTKKGKPDLIIFTAVVMLLSIGLVMVLSASSSLGISGFRDPYHYFKRQSVFAVIGVAALFFFMKLDYKILKRFALPGLLLSFALLVLVLLIGDNISGSKRWINLGFFNLQPSEVAKLFMVNFLAVYISNKRERIRLFLTGLIPALCILAAKFGLIMLEPDFGTAMALSATSLIVLFAGGAHFGQMLGLGSLAIPALWYLIMNEEYRMRRFFAYINPWKDPTDTGWNIIQSLLAIGPGGLFGLGLGNSRQKFSYLPEHHTDFIFAILCEELGFIGGMVVLLLFFVIAWRGLRIAMNAPDLYGSLLAIGITSMISFQALLNIGVVTGMLPVTGITLPFISYGGSSLLMSLASVGILLNISRQSKN